VSILLGFSKGALVIHEQCKAHTPFAGYLKKKTLEPATEKDGLTLLYMYLTYDRDSTYSGIVPLSERKKTVSHDIFHDALRWKLIESDKKFTEALDRLNMVQYSDNEKIVQMVKKKVDEYLEFLNTITFTAKNYKGMSNMIKTAKDLLKLHEDVRKLIGVEQNEHQIGGGKASFIEDDNG